MRSDINKHNVNIAVRDKCEAIRPVEHLQDSFTDWPDSRIAQLQKIFFMGVQECVRYIYYFLLFFLDQEKLDLESVRVTGASCVIFRL